MCFSEVLTVRVHVWGVGGFLGGGAALVQNLIGFVVDILTSLFGGF